MSSANNPISDRYLETMVAVETLNGLIGHLCGAGTDSNMNLLIGLTMGAFHDHDNVTFVGHFRVSVRILQRTAIGVAALWQLNDDDKSGEVGFSGCGSCDVRPPRHSRARDRRRPGKRVPRLAWLQRDIPVPRP